MGEGVESGGLVGRKTERNNINGSVDGAVLPVYIEKCRSLSVEMVRFKTLIQSPPPHLDSELDREKNVRDNG